jgi:hypothetical protein
MDVRDRGTVHLELGAIIVRGCLATSSGEKLCLPAKIRVLLLERCSLSTPSVDIDSRQTSPEKSKGKQAA